MGMLRISINLLLVSLIAASSLAEDLRWIVSQAGIKSGSLGVSREYLEAHGVKEGLSITEDYLTDPLTAWESTQRFERSLLTLRDSPSEMLAATTSFVGLGFAHSADIEALISKESPNGEGLPKLLRELTGNAQEKPLRNWPLELRQAVFVILHAQLEANQLIENSQEKLAEDVGENFWTLYRLSNFKFDHASQQTKDSYKKYKDSIKAFDTAPAISAAEKILSAVEWAAEKLRPIPQSWFRNISAAFKTPYGPIVISGIGDDLHTEKDALFILDLGGNDRYSEGGANNPAIQASSVLLDLSGSDFYESTIAAFGSGTFGVGVLWDNSGDDRYQSLGRSLGSADFGVGVLVDWDGDDYYSGRVELQGSAIAGAGMLYDKAGNDTYLSDLGSQGFGGPRGIGVLFDGSGNDRYLARNAPSLFPSSQARGRSASLSQGMGFGLRADSTDGYSLCGGAGLLVDVAGDDFYDGGLFAQGVGYWFGLGMLLDESGDDQYHTYWYGEGASAHFSAGILSDRSGDDSYQVDERMGIGAAHDLGTAIFVDHDGNDIYHSADLSLGASSAAGDGIFWDASGDDRYFTSSFKAIGWVDWNNINDIRARYDAYGVFLDTHGWDRYEQRVESRFRSEVNNIPAEYAPLIRRMLRRSDM